MSLSPLVSFKSRFLTYLLNFPRTKRKQLDPKIRKLYRIIGRMSQLSLENKLIM